MFRAPLFLQSVRFPHKVAGVIAAIAVLGTGMATANALGSNVPPGTMDRVLNASGANKDTDYPIPSGAIFVSPNGNDSAAGTASAPVRSISVAVRKAPAKGTVILRGGTYRQSIGSILKPLTLQAYPHEQPVISGADIVTGWTKVSGGWQADGWTSPFGQSDFRAAELDSEYPAAGKVEQAHRNGNPLRQVATRATLGAGKFFVDPSTRRLIVADDPTSARMELTTRDQATYLSEAAIGSKFRGLRVTAFAAPNMDAKGMFLINAANVTIENTFFDRSSGVGLMVAQPGFVMNRTTVSDNGSTGLAINRSHNAVVKNSQFLRNNAEHFSTTNCGDFCTIGGIKAAHLDNMQVLDNAFVDNDSNGYWCDLSCRHTTIRGNAITGNSGSAIFYEVSSYATITNNYIQNSNRGMKIAGSDHVTVSNNHFVNNVTHIGAYDDGRQPDADGASKNLSWNTTSFELSNNTFTGGSATKRVLDTNKTAQMDATRVVTKASGNAVSGNQTFVWVTNSSGKTFTTLDQFESATDLNFGTYGNTTPPTSSTPTSVTPTTKAPTTSTPPTTKAPTTTIPSGGGNLITSPGLEAGLGPWAIFGKSRVAVSQEKKRSGTQSLKVNATTTGREVVGATNVPSVKTVAGKTYEGICWVQSPAQISAVVRFQEYGTDWVRAGNPNDGTAVKTARSDYWYKLSVKHTATKSGLLLPFSVYSTDMVSSSAALYVDDCSVRIVS